MKFWMAFRFLKGNIVRTFFPIVAVVVGTMSLIMTLSLGEGARNIIEKDLSAIGENRLLVGGNSLGEKDLEIVERLPFVAYGTFPEKRVLAGENIYRGYSDKALMTLGVKRLRDNEVALDKTQFLGVDVGEQIELTAKYGKRKFIIGDMYQEESPFETMKVGKRVIVSDRTFGQIFGRNSYKSLVVSFPQDENGGEYIPIVLRELNRSRFKYNQVKILETPDVYKKVERIKNFVNKGLFILSFISIVVGGIGILNLIASSVRERGPHIGILRAYGVSSENLMVIFLIEAWVVIIIGASLGAILGGLGSEIVGKILRIPPYYSYMKIAIALGITMVVSILFGVYPAKKVGEMEIVAALKV